MVTETVVNGRQAPSGENRTGLRAGALANELHAPLLTAWRRFADDPGAPFTIPGHKHRAGAVWSDLGRVVEGDVPLLGGLADFKNAYAFLAEAEGIGAELWAADWCRYSVGGATHGNQAVALAVGRPGDRVLVSRTAHRSTLLGLILSGLEPVWVSAEIDDVTGLPTGVSMSDLAAAIEKNPDAVGLFLTEPSYVGTVSDLSAVVELAHRRDIPVIVDQAWGAHFGFHPDYPPHALAAGADAMVISAHKTLSAYSQGAVVLAKTDRLDRDRLDRGFDASATTSAAGSILASVDGARALLGSEVGTQLLTALTGRVAEARERLRAASALSRVVIPDPSDFGPNRFDPAKLVILLAGTGKSGNDLEAGMIAAGRPLEMADRDAIIPIVTMLDDDSTVSSLCDLLIGLAAHAPESTSRKLAVVSSWRTEMPPVQMSPREAFFAPHEAVPASAALNRVAAEVICPYPPGVPVVVPGEVISADVLEALRSASANGVRIAYAADPSLSTFQVVARR